VIVLAGQVTLDPAQLAEAGITAAYSIADYAGSVQVAIEDAAAQLTGLAGQTAAELGNSAPTRYR
jgi:glycerate kinase